MKSGLYSNYDKLVVKCLPEYPFLLKMVVGAVGNACGIIDLGCGTGNLARLIFQTHPQATILGIDSSEEFLAVAKAKCRGFDFRPVLDNILDLNLEQCACECIVSSFTIHHFDDSEKLVLFEKIFRALKPGGTFINLDMVKPKNYPKAVSKFLAKMKESGLSARFIEAERQEMIERDRPVSLSTQKKWLEQIGFEFELIHDANLFAVYCCKKG